MPMTFTARTETFEASPATHPPGRPGAAEFAAVESLEGCELRRRFDAVVAQLHDRGTPQGLLRQLGRQLRQFGPLVRQLAAFSTVGAASTVGFLVLFAALRTGLDSQAANVIASVALAVASTAANRRLTFGVQGRTGAGRQHLQGLLVFAVGLALSSGALALAEAVAAGDATTEFAILTSANLLGGIIRFVALRTWVFGAKPALATVAAE
jgi:putative flippase GtrA